ncbi:MAG TPA: biotin--[acetyl-CoA-carboxylase] ligase [Mizugakiibacter sp.]
MDARALVALLAAGEPVSGAALAARLGVTRAAVWKQVEALRARGLPVEAQAGRGYALPHAVELLDAAAIRAALPAATRARLGALEAHWELDSTSSELLRRAAQGAPDLSFVLAETQSAGRGRRGRTWLSPPALNLYLSCLKRFEVGYAALSGLSLAVGVALMRALEDVGIADVGLKWPNDALADGHKLAGILVELGGEFLGPCHAVIGIGVNLRLPPALRAQAGQPVTDLATLAGGAPPARNGFVAHLVARLVEALDAFAADGFAAFADAYAHHDLLRGRALRISGAQGAFDGIGEGIDARGALRVRRADGSVVGVDSAEVSVRAAPEAA